MANNASINYFKGLVAISGALWKIGAQVPYVYVWQILLYIEIENHFLMGGQLSFCSWVCAGMEDFAIKNCLPTSFIFIYTCYVTSGSHHDTHTHHATFVITLWTVNNSSQFWVLTFLVLHVLDFIMIQPLMRLW